LPIPPPPDPGLAERFEAAKKALSRSAGSWRRSI
jgi:hypothetical protein